MTKTLSKVGMEKNFSNLEKGIHEKSRGNIIFNHEKLNVFPLRLGARHLLFQCCIGDPSQYSKTRNIKTGKEEVKPLFADDVIL